VLHARVDVTELLAMLGPLSELQPPPYTVEGMTLNTVIRALLATPKLNATLYRRRIVPHDHVTLCLRIVQERAATSANR
jgi:hypothetical protein